VDSYVFEPEVIHEISRNHLGKSLEQMFDDVIAELAERYPGAIDDSQPWIFNNAGGVMLPAGDGRSFRIGGIQLTVKESG